MKYFPPDWARLHLLLTISGSERMKPLAFDFWPSLVNLLHPETSSIPLQHFDQPATRSVRSFSGISAIISDRNRERNGNPQGHIDISSSFENLYICRASDLEGTLEGKSRLCCHFMRIYIKYGIK
jgi:hypothetical protein